MSLPSAEELFILLKQAVPQGELTIESIARLLYNYRNKCIPTKLSTGDMNRELIDIGVKGKGKRKVRGELCICLIHMKMLSETNIIPAREVDQLCESYDLRLSDIVNDVYFRSYCHYLIPALDIVEPVKHREFIIQDVLAPISGAYVAGIRYITGGGKETTPTSIRNKVFEIESRLLRPKTVQHLNALNSQLLPRLNDTFQVSQKSQPAHPYSAHLAKLQHGTSTESNSSTQLGKRRASKETIVSTSAAVCSSYNTNASVDIVETNITTVKKARATGSDVVSSSADSGREPDYSAELEHYIHYAEEGKADSGDSIVNLGLIEGDKDWE